MKESRISWFQLRNTGDDIFSVRVLDQRVILRKPLSLQCNIEAIQDFKVLMYKLLVIRYLQVTCEQRSDFCQSSDRTIRHQIFALALEQKRSATCMFHKVQRSNFRFAIDTKRASSRVEFEHTNLADDVRSGRAWQSCVPWPEDRLVSVQTQQVLGVALFVPQPHVVDPDSTWPERRHLCMKKAWRGGKRQAG
nr:hypothetical protein CFP56_52434 [Quercus suber]